jgi:hypothetical protein
LTPDGVRRPVAEEVADMAAGHQCAGINVSVAQKMVDGQRN